MPITTMPLCFDLSRPFGPLDDGVECCVSRHSISFRNGQHCGYTHHVHCSRICKADAIHVVTFHVSGLVQEYGLNAIAVVLNDEDKDIAFSKDKYCEYSQQFAPYPECCVTLALDDVSGSLQLLVTEASVAVGAKRARSSEQAEAGSHDAPQWYHGAKDQGKWSCASIDGVKVWSKVATTVELGDVMPRIGLRLCPLTSPKATIVECPAAVKTLLMKDSERMLHLYTPGAVDVDKRDDSELNAIRTTFVDFMKKKIYPSQWQGDMKMDGSLEMIGKDTICNLLIGSDSDKSYTWSDHDKGGALKEEALMIVAKAMFPKSA